jgi:hypothetical protein
VTLVGIDLPDEGRLPPGPARELVSALHELYRGAGRPGLRKIWKAIADGDFSEMVSHETISDMLNGKGVPRWAKVNCVVRQLAAWNNPRHNPDQVAARFLSLWEAASGIADSLDKKVAAVHEADPEEALSDYSALGDFFSENRKKRDEWTQARHALIEGMPQWRGPTGDKQTTQLRKLKDNLSSHPSFVAEAAQQDCPPVVRVGVRVACNSPADKRMTSSEIRRSFLKFLRRRPVAFLIEGLTTVDPDARWEIWGGHGWSNHEVVLAGTETRAASAWARLLLPEPELTAGRRDVRSALLLLHAERHPPDAGGIPERSIPLLDWHSYFKATVECASAFAHSLIQDLCLEIPLEEGIISSLSGEDHIASVAIWLNTPKAMTDLVDISGYRQLPGSPTSSQFDAYAVTHPEGIAAHDMAIDWMSQIGDYTLHLDDYETAVFGLRQRRDGSSNRTSGRLND